MASITKYRTLKRIEAPHIARGLNFSCFHNRRFLRSDRACNWVINCVERALREHDVDLWAWCLMPSHVHLLVYPRADQPDIGAFLESLKKSSNRRALRWIRANAPAFLPTLRDVQPNGRVSHRFWQPGGGYDRNLWSPLAIWRMINYIHGNPVADGLVARPQDWKWSSAAWYIEQREIPLAVCTEQLPGRPPGV